MDLFRQRRPWIFCTLSSWVVNALWNDAACRLSTFLSVYNFEAYVGKKKKKGSLKTPKSLSYITLRRKQSNVQPSPLILLQVCV
jgi:hypothetical protein